MKIAIGYTFAKRWEQTKYSNNNIKETIAYLEELQQECNSGGIWINDLDEILWFLYNVEFVDGINANAYSGSIIYIDDLEEFKKHINYISSIDNCSSIHELWLIMLRNFNEAIDELYRYGFQDTNECVVFLRALATVLSYVTITDSYDKFADMVV